MLSYQVNKTQVLSAAVIVAMLSGCSTPIVLNVPVGPDPSVATIAGPNGVLQVFSEKEEENDVGYEFPYHQRTDYYIYDSNGKKRERVNDNNIGHFESTPRGIRLPAGTYTVKALAAVGLGEWVTVPVVIEAGRTTGVHLNGSWRPPADTPKSQLVQSPAGFPMGWRAAPPNG